MAFSARGNAVARKRAAERMRPQPSAETERSFGQVYQGAQRHGTFMGAWPAFLGSADRDWLPARNLSTARARDLFRNDPVAKSAVSRKKNAAVGKGWRFTSKPDADALGVTPEVARALGKKISTEWKHYAGSYNFMADAERRFSFGQLLRLAASHLIIDGEFLAKVEYANDNVKYRTCLRLIDPDRLSNPTGRPDTPTLRGGIETDANKVPVRYWIRQAHQFDIGFAPGAYVWQPHNRYSTPLGRPNILHGFDPDRSDQTRGISAFVASLKSFRGFGQYSDATIQSAVINSLVVGYMKSSAGPEAVSEVFGYNEFKDFSASRSAHYDKNPVPLGDAVMPVVPLGDELVLQTATKDVGSFEAFTRAIIRLIAASLGITYEELSMDYSQTNYSSARAAMVHAWSEIQAFMGTLREQLVKPFFVAWLEEAFDSGYVEAPEGAPDFYGAIDAYADGLWLGPAKGYIDPTKEILAAAARIEAGISTLEDECAEQGKDWEDVLVQQGFETATRKQLGLVPQDFADGQAIQDTKNPARTAPPPTPDNGDEEGVTPEDKKPAPAQGAFSMFRRAGSALAALAGIANSAEHEAALDARPGNRAA